MIGFACPQCGKLLNAPPDAAGSNGWCSCGAMFVVPSAPVAPRVIDWKPEPEPPPAPAMSARIIAQIEETDDEFWERLHADAARKARRRKSRARAIIITAIPVVLFIVACFVVPAALQRIRDAEEQKLNPKPPIDRKR